MTMVSYAQIGEDVLLRRVFPPHYPGFYMDVGANHPVYCSVTKHFYDSGWQGINIEPGAVFGEVEKHRTRDLNLNIAVSNERSSLTFYEFPDATALSTLSPEVAKIRSAEGQRCVERTVPVRTLADICEEYVGDRTIDFMSIDVEGRELEVIQGADWKKFRPRVMLVEANGVESWQPILEENGYIRANFDGINVWFVRQEDDHWLEPLRIPVTADDQYIAASHLKGLIDCLEQFVDDGTTEQFSSTSLKIGMKVAYHLRQTSQRFPGLASFARRVTGRAA